MSNDQPTNTTTRRNFLKQTAATAAVAGFPTILPSSLFGQYAPSKRINVGAIGCGRISRVHDLPGIWQFDNARIMAVSDLYAPRVEEAKRYVNAYYAKKTGKPYDGVTGYANYRDLLANKDIDAVVISTPDHQHAIVAVDAVRAGKDVYLQKPASLTIAEGVTSRMPSRPPAAFCRSVHSSVPGYNSATPRSLSAMAGSAILSTLRSAFRRPRRRQSNAHARALRLPVRPLARLHA